MQQVAFPGNPHGQTDTLRRAIERAVRLWLTAGGGELEADLLLRAMFDDPDSDATRAFAALGISVSDLVGPTTEPLPRPRADVMMARFSSEATAGLEAGHRVAREEERPTATGDVVVGLLEADRLAERSPVSAEAVRRALARIGREP